VNLPRAADSDGMANLSTSLAGVPLRLRGYDRSAAGALFATLEQRQRVLAQERDDLRLRVEDLTAELDQHRIRAQAVADALVTAQKIAVDLRAAAEAEIEEERRGVEEEREHLLDEGAAIRAEARQEATEIVREARIRADRLIEEIVSALVAYQHEAEDFVSGSGERLTSLVHELLTRMPGSAPELPPELELEVELDAEADGGPAGIADVA
jgi:cell division septum initiation protein DivIVA